MKLLSCHIDAFGKFKDVNFKFDEKLSIFCEKNGFGKTTLAEFIKAMFYSLPPYSRKNNFKSERDLYKPFDYDGAFGGRLTFSCKKGKFTVVRQFGSTPTLDKFYLFDAKTNLISNEFSSNLGDELFGVGKETFENSTFFGQQHLVSGINDDIRASLSTGVLSGDDIDNFEKSQNQIQKKMKEIRSQIKDLKIDDLNIEIERYKSREEVLKLKLENLETELQKLNYTQLEMQKSNKRGNDKDVSSYINKNISLESVVEADKEKIFEKSKQKEMLLKKSKISKQDFDFVDGNTNIEKGHNSNKTSFAMIFVALLGFVCLLCGGILKINFLFILGSCIALISLVVLIICLFISRKCAEDLKHYNEILKKYGLNQKSLKEEISNFSKIYNDIKFIDEDIKNLNLEIEKNTLQAKNLQKQFAIKFGFQLDNYYIGIEERNRKINSIDRRITEYKTDKKHYNEEYETLQEKLFELYESLEYAKEKYNVLQNNLNLLNKVSIFLEKSKDAISNKFISPVTTRFNRYYKELLSDGDEIIIDANLGMRFGSKYNEIDFLSAGLYDLVYICKRFALVDLLFKKEKPMLILDDPFANFDDEKLQSAKMILEELKKDYQIVMFTCQKSRS